MEVEDEEKLNIKSTNFNYYYKKKIEFKYENKKN